MQLEELIKRKAIELGFVKAGITTADPFPEHEQRFRQRLDHYKFFVGPEGEDPMGLLAAADPKRVFPEAKSIISVAASATQVAYPQKLLDLIGRIYLARNYLPPADTVAGARLELLTRFIEEQGVHVLGTIPLPDRASAARAGVATFGRNNFTYVDGYGSFVVLTSFAVDVELEPDEPTERCACPPDCRRCVDACPTHAMADDGALNPDRCVLRNNFSPDEAVFEDVFDLMGTRIHGCDFCQTACPRNKRVLERPATPDPLLESIAEELTLERLLTLDDEDYERLVRPIMYNYIQDLDLFRRNAAIAMGNSGDTRYIEPLRAARDDASPLVRRHIDRALAKLEESAA